MGVGFKSSCNCILNFIEIVKCMLMSIFVNAGNGLGFDCMKYKGVAWCLFKVQPFTLKMKGGLATHGCLKLMGICCLLT